MPIRTASARWQGTLTEGSGTIATGKGGLQGNYSFKSRFEEGEGTNPEELIAAAHAGCFSMAFSKQLSDAGFPPAAVVTNANVHLDKTDAIVTELDRGFRVPAQIIDFAARLLPQIAPTLGVSLYTWTSVIGVVLGGLALGSWLGGRLAGPPLGCRSSGPRGDASRSEWAEGRLPCTDGR